jgi:hypothetical protein
MTAGESAIIGETVRARDGKRREMVELVVGYGLILLVIWTPRPWQRILYCAAVVFLVAAMWMSFRGWSEMGIRLKNFWRSMWIVGVALAAVAALVGMAVRLHTLHATGDGVGAFVERFWGYALWAFVQQVLLQDFFLRRVLDLMGRKQASAVLVTALVFALAHLPNPVLTPVTFVWALVACGIFLRYRNIFPLAISHAMLGITLAITVPSPVIRNMRVGLGYLTYPATHGGMHREHQRSQMDHTVSTVVWVSAEAATRRS